MEIKFDPQNLEERQEVLNYLTNGKYASAIDDIYQKARSVLKHGDTDHAPLLVETLEYIKRVAGEANFDE